jgi:hypothetical protein
MHGISGPRAFQHRAHKPPCFHRAKAVREAKSALELFFLASASGQLHGLLAGACPARYKLRSLKTRLLFF